MDKVMIVTGGSSDVAAAIYRELDKRTEEKITIFAQYNSHDIGTSYDHLDIRPVKADLSDPSGVDALTDAVKKSGLTPTHIIHLAAVPYEYVRIKEWDTDRTDKQMRVGVYSFASVCKAFLPDMAKKKEGDIVVMLTNAVTDTVPPKFMCEYVTAKYALLGYTKSLVAEYESKGIKIHTFAPSMMETKFLANIDPKIVEIDAQNMPGGHHMSVDDLAKDILDAIGI